MSGQESNEATKHKLDTKTLKFFYTNARSLIVIDKRTELEMYVVEESPDVIAITESWAKESISDNELQLEGYMMFRKDRICNRNRVHGGGVLLYVKDHLIATERKDLDTSSFKESIWCVIKCKKVELLVGVCYREPDSSRENDIGLQELMSKAGKMSLILMGDFNYHIDWQRRLGQRNMDRVFLKFVDDHFLFQHVHENTNDKNVLDLVFSTDEHVIEDLLVGEKFNTSDHRIIRFNVLVEIESKMESHSKKLNFFKANYELVRKKIEDTDLVHNLNHLEVEERWRTFLKIMKSVIEDSIPEYKKYYKKWPWYNQAVKKTRRSRNKAWNKLQVFKKNIRAKDMDESFYDKLKLLRDKYVKKRNIAKATVKKAIRTYEEKLCHNIKNDSKSFYSYMRSKHKKKDTVGPLKNHHGVIITDPLETAHELNNYFGSVFTKENMQVVVNPESFFDEKDNINTRNPEITIEMVVYRLAELKEDKTPGPDNLYPKFLKEIRHQIGPFLTQLYKDSIETGVVPRDWRDAIVVPLFKKGNRGMVNNYRPVSMTCIICKILEKIIKEEMLVFLNEHHIIKNSQHGFREGRSSLSNLLDFYYDIYESLDKSNSVDIIYLDFAKAFDKVPHERLALKLQACGIGGNILRWIQNWLKDRRQRVSIKGASSDWIKVESGVPQGSVLGPLLFVIYINDLEKDINSKVSMFADDTKLHAVVNKEEDANILRRDLNRIWQWSLDWQMQFNVEKCAVMHIGKKNPRLPYSMGGNVIQTIQEGKDLGVLISQDMKLARQCILAAGKANKMLGIIKRTVISRDKKMIISLYKALVRPHLEYCVQAWNPYMQGDIKMLERVQRRATKLIKDFGNLDYRERLKRCNLTSLEERRCRGDLIEVFKIMKSKDPELASKFFILPVKEGLRGHKYKIQKRSVNNTVFSNFFCNRVVTPWNNLKDEIVAAKTVNSFKNFLDESGNTHL